MYVLQRILLGRSFSQLKVYLKLHHRTVYKTKTSTAHHTPKSGIATVGNPNPKPKQMAAAPGLPPFPEPGRLFWVSFFEEEIGFRV